MAPSHPLILPWIISGPQSYESHTFIPGSLKGSGVETTKWTELWKHTKGNSHTGCVWECRLELSTGLCKNASGPPKIYLYLSLLLCCQKKHCRVYWNLWRVHPTHQPSTWNGSKPWQRNLQKSYILPFDSMSWRSGCMRAVKVQLVPLLYGYAAKAVEFGWESKM